MQRNLLKAQRLAPCSAAAEQLAEDLWQSQRQGLAQHQRSSRRAGSDNDGCAMASRDGGYGHRLHAHARNRGAAYDCTCPDDSWAQELAQAGGGFERQEASRWQKSDSGKADAESRARNDAILKWLESNDVWVSELSGWNEPPHSLALATSTFDELEGEDSGRGLLARRAIAQDAILARLPVRLCMTKEAALQARELKGIVSQDTNEYVAIACC